jgi:Adenylate and Guanylate cyclase catalytic domain/zinc-ribbon domain
MKVCSACGQENPDVAKFCLACGAPLEAPAPAPSAEERKLVTVLFTDIVGSTAKAEQMDPEDVRARLAPYYTRLRAELERHGGTVEKFIGDAVVALFGAPTAHEDDPERAVRAALAIRHALRGRAREAVAGRERARRGGDGGASRADGRLPGRRGGTGARLPARPRAVPDGGARRRASVDLRLGTCLRRRPPAPRFEYTDEEYAHRLGWGHSSVAHASAFARAAGVRRLAMFHHDPMRSDREIEELYDEVAAIVRDDQEPPLIAREGLEVRLAAA